jgi:hypothetical protein
MDIFMDVFRTVVVHFMCTAAVACMCAALSVSQLSLFRKSLLYLVVILYCVLLLMMIIWFNF